MHVLINCLIQTNILGALRKGRLQDTLASLQNGRGAQLKLKKQTLVKDLKCEEQLLKNIPLPAEQGYQRQYA